MKAASVGFSVTSKFAKSEWATALARDPEGVKRSLVLVRVRDCEAP